MRASPAIRPCHLNRSIIASTAASTGPMSAPGEGRADRGPDALAEIDQVVHRDLPAAVGGRRRIGERAGRAGIAGRDRVDDPIDEDDRVAQEPAHRVLVVALAERRVAVDRDLERARGEALAGGVDARGGRRQRGDAVDRRQTEGRVAHVRQSSVRRAAARSGRAAALRRPMPTADTMAR